MNISEELEDVLACVKDEDYNQEEKSYIHKVLQYVLGRLQEEGKIRLEI